MISQPYISAGPKYHVQTSALTFNSIQFFSKIKEREREREREIKVRNSTKPKFLIQSTRSILKRIIWKTRNIDWLIVYIEMSPLRVRGCIIWALACRLWPLSRGIFIIPHMLWQSGPESLTAFIKRLHCKPATGYWGQRTYSKKKKKKNPTAYIIEHSWGYN